MMTVRRFDQVRPPQLGVPVDLLSAVFGAPSLRGPRWDSDLVRLYRLAQQNQKEAALDLIFQGIDRLLCEGRFDACDELLRDVDLKRLNATLIVGLLNATLPASDRLPGRPTFVEHAYQQLRALRGDDAAARLIERHRAP